MRIEAECFEEGMLENRSGYEHPEGFWRNKWRTGSRGFLWASGGSRSRCIF
ncbi:hypothetical protein Plhal304r1_c016g0060301 [Plasmopara halstedii]